MLVFVLQEHTIEASQEYAFRDLSACESFYTIFSLAHHHHDLDRKRDLTDKA